MEGENGEPDMQVNLPLDPKALVNKPEQSWTDEERRALAAHRWANWQTEIDAIQVIVSEIPGARVTWDDLPESRLTLQFVVHLTSSTACAGAIFRLLKTESHALRPTPGALGRLIRLKVRQFVWKGQNGGWHALCIDGSKWKFQEEQALWIEDKPEGRNSVGAPTPS
jgi:hypothetical protein